ncbi:SMP-30/gluconolactonase/LRE family protein [Chelatococcus asaccharovorans]|uniref:Sugar lactone lactonase YvrE n=1 Tax=Chelatococcus asaccharovorans TaxID=28210 RepID=A0A2V3TZP6_9HYPH|nr:SMP-30/gluconolactonase/LRE family protein [Chelatococcus asaccharovorans]MBS7707798.1 SMP-30/gluconolactonase/LRE family protein [Chelatococcus asaccharovorans]PXW55096.1 sugar lactone lactonase YvrE [Chelatococcus asaccharovorans]
MRAVTEPIDTLGESPVWSVAEEALYWVDIRAPSLCRLAGSGVVTRWPLPELVGAVMLRQAGGLILGLKSGLHAFTIATGRLEPLLPVDEGHAGNRINDSRCDRQGNIWFTTMWDFGRERTGSVYRVDRHLALTRVLDGLTVPNALCFSPGGDRAYIADSAVGAIDCLELGAEEGVSHRRCAFVPAGEVAGKPDGATVDAEGFIWNARFGAGLLARFSPDGRLDRLVPLPVSNPTSCSFGGADLGTLFITTATQGLSPAQRAAEPLAGAVLAFEPGVRGLAEPAFAG